MRAIKADRRLLARKYLGVEDVMSVDGYERSVYYRDIVRPAGSRDVVVLPIAGKRRVAGGLAIMKPAEVGEGGLDRIRLRDYLDAIAAGFSLPENITVVSRLEPATMEIERAILLGLAIQAVIENAMLCPPPGERRGYLDLSLRVPRGWVASCSN